MRAVVNGRTVKGGVAVGLTGLVLALSVPGTAAAAPVVKVECGSSASVAPGTSIQLTLLGIPLGGLRPAGAVGTNVLTGAVDALLGTVCKVVVTVVEPVVAVVPTAVTDPIATAVAPIASAVAAAPPVAVPVPGVGTVQLGGSAAPATTKAPAPGSAGGATAGGSTVGGSPAGGSAPAVGAPAASPGIAGSVQGADATALLPGATAAGGGTGTGTATGSTTGTGTGGLLPAGGGRPSVFGSPLLAGYTSSGSAAQFGSLGSIPVGTAASETSVQALDSALGSRPGLVVFAAVLALAATAGCTVRQWVLRAVPALATPATVVPVTRAAHRR